MSDRERQLLAAKPIVPAVIALLYGAYKFFDLGFAIEHYLYTYVPVFGAVVSSICILLYLHAGSKRSVKNMIMGLGGFVPYVFSLYLMGFLGAFSLWGLLSDFSIGTLVFGIVWIVIGYRMLYTFWMITEITKSN